jgi:hypothetical protein
MSRLTPPLLQEDPDLTYLFDNKTHFDTLTLHIVFELCTQVVDFSLRSTPVEGFNGHDRFYSLI